MDRIGDYIICKEIFKTPRTIVYRGHHQENKSPVIIELIHSWNTSTANMTKFKQEYAFLKKGRINGIVKIYDQFQYNGDIAIILEDIHAVPIRKLWNRNKIDLDLFLNLAIQLSDILGNLHKEKIVHYGISPHNVLVEPNHYDIKLSDIGIAKVITSINEIIVNSEEIETLYYISPEQTGRLNCTVDYRTDIYSLGILFYEMVTGNVPFKSDDPIEVIHSHIARQPVPPGKLNHSIPKIISNIILKLLSKTADDRYQNAFGLMADLKKCKTQLEANKAIVPFELGQSDVSAHFLMPQRLFGRKQEQAVILKSFEQITRMGNAQMILVSGQPGVGKSALINTVYEQMMSMKGYFIFGKYDQYLADMPYSSIIQAFQRLAKQILSQSRESIALWGKKLQKALGRNGRIICEVIPEVELIIDPQPDVPATTPQKERNRFNLVFKNFINAFSDKKHPLVMFLDDLQWADLASFNLLRKILKNKENGNLLIIGTYRVQDIDESHILTTVLAELKNQDVIIDTISLGPLNIIDIKHLIIDFFKCHQKKALKLAEAVHQITGGNPFFVKQFLQNLFDMKILEYHLSEGWKWDIDAIYGLQVTNVVELLTEKINDLTATTQKIIKIAACIGTCFELETISTVSKIPMDLVIHSIVEAVDKALIFNCQNKYCFVHDRVLEAAYLLVPDREKSELHYLIGNYYLDHTEDNHLQTTIFDIVNQLNHGVELITTEKERIKLAKLNCMAGKKAKRSAAYQSAINYLNTGMELLGSNAWRDHYDLSLALYTQGVEAEFLNTDFNEMERLAQIVLAHTSKINDQVNVYGIKIQALMVRNHLMDAVDLTHEVLKLLGIEIPRHMTQAVVEDIFQNKMALFEIEDQEILDFAEMTDPCALAAIKIATSAASAFYSSGRRESIFLVFEMVLLSFKYGNSPLSAVWFAILGLVFITFDDCDNGYRFGNLALKLVEKYDAREIKSRVINTVNVFIMHWKKPLKETIPELQSESQMDMENGDLEYVSWNVFHYTGFTPFFCGKELKELEHDMSLGSRVIGRFKHKSILQYNQMYHQTVLNLMGKSENAAPLTGAVYNPEEMRPVHNKANDRLALFFSYLLDLMLNYLFENFEAARHSSHLAKPVLDAAAATYPFTLFYFYRCLTRLALIDQTMSGSKKKEQLDKVAYSQEKLRLWAKHSPQNHLHKYHLVNAEIARVEGNILQADDLYQKAIKGAYENGFIQEQALANELAARCWQSAGKPVFAELYLRKAYKYYRLWGAYAKLKAFEIKYASIFKTNPLTENNVKASSVPVIERPATETMDISSVMKSCQALSKEIELAKLLKRVMVIAIENAGAQKAILLLRHRKDRKLYIEASAQVDGEINVNDSVLMEKSDKLSVGIVNYVDKTGESLILNNACHEGIFINDPYVVKNKSKSILCAPLATQKNISAIIYLENKLSVNAFPNQRLEMIKILFSQVSISLENAILYNNLLQEITERETAQAELSDSEKRFMTLFEYAPDAYCICDLHGRICDANQAFINLLGYHEKKDFLFQKIYAKDNSPEKDEHIFGNVIERHFLSAKHHLGKEIIDQDEMVIQRFDKQKQIDIEIKSIPVKIKGDDFILGILHDITKRKQAENNLRESEQSLRRENKLLVSMIDDRYRFGKIIGKSQVMQGVYRLILKAAATDMNVIVYGETGTGKELVSRAIHDLSSRKQQKFVTVNCGAIPENLAESEFFGYKKGAFTGADTDKKGFLDEANEGTLFLDEIGEIGLNMQVKLLRAVEGGGYTPVGSNQVKQSNFRVIAATNKNLADLVDQGQIRSDFYYRINVIQVQIPALRQRKEDLPLLIEHFAKNEKIHGHVIDELISYDWPGNIRELQNVVQRYLIFNQLDFLKTDSKPMSADTRKSRYGYNPSENLKQMLSLLEQKIIAEALVQNQWHKGNVCTQLGIDRKTLNARMIQYKLKK